MATFNDHKIAVWERSTKLGKWCPYSADICQLLEENLKKKNLDVCFGDVDEELKVYSVNLNNMIQLSETTGTKCPVRRRLCDCLCVLGRGFSWQWLGDHNIWHIFDVDVNDFIDIAFLEGKSSVNLSKKFPGYNYEIVFSKMIQINKHSKRKRKVRRTKNTAPYPVVKSPEDSANDENSEPVKETHDALNPDFLAEEIPGTAALINQVNAYKRNVENSEGEDPNDSKLDETAGHSGLKHQKVSEGEQDKKFQLEQSSAVATTTVALVNGKPWTDSWPPHTPESLIKPVPGVDPLPKMRKPKKSKGKGAAKGTVVETSVLDKYTEIMDLSSANNEQCIICCDSLSSPSSYNDDSTICKLILCSHIFHKACIEAMFNSSPKEFLQCPSCKKIHGEKCGIQPPGNMIYHVLPYSLPGYPESETIRIIYDIHSGIQGSEHPNPGKRYTTRGFPRHCYLPDNEMGRKVLRLLIKAWKRRLIFTIGRSSTTGEENTVTWNEIHHKTEFGCNRRGHGYPDPNYFSNVLAELEAHGVIDDESHEWYPA